MARTYYDLGVHVIVLSETHIRKMAEAIEDATRHAEWVYSTRQEPANKVIWRAHFTDNTADNDLTTDQVLSLQNGKERRITGLRVKADPGYGRIEIAVSQNRFGFWEAEATGNEALIATFKPKIRELMSELRPWWNGFAYRNFASYPPIIAVVFLLCRMAYVSVAGGSTAGDPSISDEAIADALFRVAIAFTVIWGIFAWLDRFRHYFFPVFSVLIGDGVTRADNAKGRRNYVIGAMLPLLLLFFGWVASPNPFLVDKSQSSVVAEEPADSASK